VPEARQVEGGAQVEGGGQVRGGGQVEGGGQVVERGAGGDPTAEQQSGGVKTTLILKTPLDTLKQRKHKRTTIINTI